MKTSQERRGRIKKFDERSCSEICCLLFVCSSRWRQEQQAAAGVRARVVLLLGKAESTWCFQLGPSVSPGFSSKALLQASFIPTCVMKKTTGIKTVTKQKFSAFKKKNKQKWIKSLLVSTNCWDLVILFKLWKNKLSCNTGRYHLTSVI